MWDVCGQSNEVRIRFKNSTKKKNAHQGFDLIWIVC